MITAVRGHSYPAIFATLTNFADTSYGNDVTDSVVFSVGERGYTIWIDAVYPAERVQEFGWDPSMPVTATNKPPARFTICALEDADAIYGNEATERECNHGERATLRQVCLDRQLVDGRSLFESDDPDAVMSFIGTLPPRGAA